MQKRLTRTGNSLALVLDKPLLDALGIDADTLLEVSTDGSVLLVSPVRDRKRTDKLKAVMERAHRQYAGVFRKLAE
ncbi:MAG: AbrB/MazE/SpoVT family DNA-binding domain-containing protein [Myxococcaceae bacterium]|nr:AbrB/MazE/SpoVT family DNA-binding domain-containing protein [Myxococcaceae bacterium]MCI0670196.1 AbrB/MazE/SpoVT family DNA-binding domain-containing protein [Myxococcaceae bacterium]